MKLKLKPERRREILNRSSNMLIELRQIAKEIGSKRMEEKLESLAITFFRRMEKDRNLPKYQQSIEAEMDDSSGDDINIYNVGEQE